ncbi:protein O-mannosyltransferase 1-like [Amphibalanus amphitrite]|uniref:protein O-mannosyltransferase 1-like n=1 Tax=Amphibalanus amphitrite TaxID=1232801 RepID=UPI001C927CE7|nr:protein O-mannosyltransferase 1-like [Amphibalanus amphitrite]
MAVEDSDLRQRKKKSPKKATDAITGQVVDDEDLVKTGIEKLKKIKKSLVASSDSDEPDTKSKPKPSRSAAASSSAPASGGVQPHHGFDGVALLLLIGGLLTRLHQLGLPRAIVFDELHFGKFAGYYVNNMFFFDSQPPLGKQLLALAAHFAGFDGNFNFDRIGSEYPEGFPVYALRLLPAVAGSLLLPASYCLLRQLGVSRPAAGLAGLLLLLDNAVLVQSRFMLMEPFLLLFSVLGVFCLVRFRHYRERPFSLPWLGWLTAGFVFLGAATSVRYSGLLTLLLGAVIVCRDFWTLIPNRRVTSGQLLAQLAARALAVLAVPLLVYGASFYAHLTVLHKAGAHDNVMTSAFQASLDGGLASIIQNQPLEVGHGSQVTLRHTLGRTCWLHSHEGVYPVKYDDDRGSSHQQQVSCYSYKDVNNWWIVKQPDIDDMRVTSPFKPVKHGDIIQLVHGMTSRALNSHDVAAPMTPGNQEVSCYIDYNISMPAQNLWKVELLNGKDTGNVWHAIVSQVRLIHQPSGTALKFTGQQLPDWGHNQLEVTCDKVVQQDDTIWNAEEHRYTLAEGSEKQQEDMAGAEMLPLSSARLSLWAKFTELQLKMLFNNQETVQGHMYASDPLDWLSLKRGVAYWISPDSNAQVHFLGNAAVWLAASASLAAYAGIMGIYLLRRRRECYDIPEDEWDKMCDLGLIVLLGFALNYLPYFIIDHTFFLHHYLPAYIFAVLMSACIVDHVFVLLGRVAGGWLRLPAAAGVLLWLAAAVYTFIRFSVVTYGTTPLSAPEVQALAWRDTWDLIVHKP